MGNEEVRMNRRWAGCQKIPPRKRNTVERDRFSLENVQFSSWNVFAIT